MTKKDLVAAAIRAEIGEGKLAAGTHLRQHEVAARLRVSPTPVREAFGVLALEGLVAWDAYRGVTVAHDPRGRLTLADFFELRAAVEMLAVRAGGGSPDPAVLDALEDAEGDAERAERAGDVTRWPLANSRFHATLVELARSEFLTQLMGTLVRASMFFPSTQSLRVHGAHQAILRALKAGDAELAARLVAEHARANVAKARRDAAAHSRLMNGAATSRTRTRTRSA